MLLHWHRCAVCGDSVGGRAVAHVDMHAVNRLACLAAGPGRGVVVYAVSGPGPSSVPSGFFDAPGGVPVL